ncbi:chaperone [Burkholderia sp. Bp9031]|uniref:transcriptional regulator n=1 Tax=Burkholderia sp. Bp9031 TaxID=2184566 RepID=UPI000F5DC7BF|nr:YdaS family helix-turn-helix protein [Burkholderia sp. Bp9031]RQZ17257.1 chaperone [Burkholderia sp. Bp9031]
METSAIKRACAEVGGQSALARKLNCTPQAVQKMCASGRVPSERVLEIERISGISRHELRPDLYPEPTVADPQQEAA